MSNETLKRTGLQARDPKTPPNSPELRELFDSVDLVTARKMKHFVLNNTGDCIFLDSALGIVLNVVIDPNSTGLRRQRRLLVPYLAVTCIGRDPGAGLPGFSIYTAHSTIAVCVDKKEFNEHSEKLMEYMYQYLCYRVNGAYLRDVKPELFVVPGPPATAPQKTETIMHRAVTMCQDSYHADNTENTNVD